METDLQLKSIDISEFAENPSTDGPRYSGVANFTAFGLHYEIELAIEFADAVSLEAGLNQAYRELANWAGSLQEAATQLSNRQSIGASR